MSTKDVKNSVKDFFGGGKLWVLTVAVLGIVLGILMIADPEGFLNLARFALGAVLVLFGVVQVVLVFARRGDKGSFGGMAPGILSLAVGMAFFFRWEAIRELLTFLIGLAILLDAVYKLEHAFAMKAASVPFWWASLLSAILAMILAVVVMIYAREVGRAMVVLSGAVILANGIFDLAEFVLLILAGKRMKTVATVVIEDAPVTDLENVEK